MEPAAGLRRMLEDTLTLPFRGAGSWSALGERPAPPYPVLICNLLVFTAAGAAVGFLRADLLLPALAPVGAATAAAAALAAALLAVPLSFAAAGSLHACMLLAGGRGDFQRSYQAASLLSATLVLLALLGGSDWVWPLPLLLAAWLAAQAARCLHRAPAWRAGSVFLLLGAAGLSGQWWLRRQAAQRYEAARAARWAAAASQDLARQMQQLQQFQRLPLPAPAATPGPGAVSGLQLIMPPGGQDPGPAARPAGRTPSAPELAALLQPVLGRLADPALTKDLPPEQAEEMQALAGVLGRMQAALSEGRPVDPQEQAALLSRLEAVMSRFSARLQTVAAKKPAAGAK